MIPSSQPASAIDLEKKRLKELPLDGRVCKYCSELFNAKRYHQVFCCSDHRTKHFWAGQVTIPREELEELKRQAQH